jgi:hypothetical protein
MHICACFTPCRKWFNHTIQAGPLQTWDMSIMKICRITLDLVYQDSATGAPKTERTLQNLIDRSLDPLLGEYMTCSSGVVMKQIKFPDVTMRDSDEKRTAWSRHAEQQLALIDIERYAVTHAVSTPVAAQRARTAGKKK